MVLAVCDRLLVLPDGACVSGREVRAALEFPRRDNAAVESVWNHGREEVKAES